MIDYVNQSKKIWLVGKRWISSTRKVKNIQKKF